MSTKWCQILRMEQTKDIFPLVTRVYPYGGGLGDTRITLSQCTKTAPAGYVLDRVNNYIEHTAAAAAYGCIEKVITFKEITSVNAPGSADTNASDALYQAALAYLQRHSAIHKVYDLDVGKVEATIRVGEKMPIYYHEYAGHQEVANIEVKPWLLELTEQIDRAGAHTVGLKVADVDVWPPDDDDATAMGVEEFRNYQAYAGPQSAENLTIQTINQYVTGATTHDELGGVTADQHHVGFVGLAGDSGSAAPSATDIITIAGGTALGTTGASSTITIMPSFAAPGTNLSVSTTNAEGSASNFARSDHSHAITTSTNPGATASILASDASGYLQLAGLGIGAAAGAANRVTIADGGSIGQASGPLITFDDTHDYLEIMGCDVGIGTASPGDKLTVLGGNIVVRETDDGNDAFKVSASTFTSAIRVYNAGSTVIQFHGDSNEDSYINAGNFGIGTTEPQALIHGIKTTEQLRLGYDTDKYFKLTVEADNDVVVDTTGNIIKFASSVALAADNYASQTTGWRVTYGGSADFRYLFTDEMHAKSFIADLEQALAGGEIICKSVAVLAADFSIPTAGNTGNFVVEAFDGFTTFKVFVDGDLVRFRQFSRSGTSLTIADGWGTVTWVSTDETAKTQTYQLTRSSGDDAGTASGTIPQGTLVLDYGTSGNGFVELNSIDGAMAENAPYMQVVTWTTHPRTGQTCRLRAGNLYGITSQAGEYGLFAGNGFGNTNQYLRVSTEGFHLYNLDLSVYDGETLKIRLDHSTPYFAIGGATGFATGDGIWMGKDTVYKWRVGDADGERIQWDGSALELIDSAIKLYDGADLRIHIDPSVPSIAIGATPPTGKTSGTGIWTDKDGIYGLDSNTQQAIFDATTGAITAGAGAVVLDAIGINLSTYQHTHSFGIIPAPSFPAGTTLRWVEDGSLVAGIQVEHKTDEGGFLGLNVVVQSNIVSGGEYIKLGFDNGSVFTPKITIHLQDDVHIGGMGLSVGTKGGATTGDVLASGDGLFEGGLNVGTATGAGTGDIKCSDDIFCAGGLNVGTATGAAAGQIFLTLGQGEGAIKITDTTNNKWLEVGHGNNYAVFNVDADTTAYWFRVDSATKVEIKANGYVGINCSPGSRLDVVDNRDTFAMRVFNDGNVSNRLGIKIQAGQDDGNDSWMIGCYDGDDTYHGYLGLVNQNVEIVQASDERLKRDIESAESVLERLRQVEVSSYWFKRGGPRQRGFISQRLQQVFPEATVYAESEDTYGVLPLQMIPVNTRAIQEVDDEVMMLRARVVELEEQVAQLRAA